MYLSATEEQRKPTGHSELGYMVGTSYQLDIKVMLITDLNIWTPQC